MKINKNLFWAALALLTVFRFWFSGQVILTGDEAYHWEWSRHLAWGYYDHPPMVAFIIRFFTEIFGNNLTAIRAAGVVFSSLSVVLVYLTARDISQSEDTGFLAGILVMIIPIYTAGSFIITTDTPHAFFWLLSVYTFYKALFGGDRYWWYLGGVSLGFTLLSKFFAFIFPAGLFAYLILSKRMRFWVKKKEPYLAALIALLIFSPFLWWNYKHDWVTFGFNLVNRHKTPDLSFKYFFEYLSGQALLIFPAFFILYIFSLFKAFFIGIREDGRYLFLFFTSAPLWILFLFISSYQRVGIHWPIAAYFSGIILIALFRKGAPEWFRGILKAGIYCSAAFLLAVHLAFCVLLNYPQIIPWNWAYAGRPDKINAQVLRELFGWEEIDKRIDQSYTRFGGGFIFTNSYAFSSQLSFYCLKNPFVYMLGEGSVHGRNYDFWQDNNFLKGKNALLVSKEGKDLSDCFKKFQRIEAEDPLKIYINGYLVRTILFYRCYNYLGI